MLLNCKWRRRASRLRSADFAKHVIQHHQQKWRFTTCQNEAVGLSLAFPFHLSLKQSTDHFGEDLSIWLAVVKCLSEIAIDLGHSWYCTNRIISGKLSKPGTKHEGCSTSIRSSCQGLSYSEGIGVMSRNFRVGTLVVQSI